MNTNTNTTLQIVREIHAPKDRVYAAWTDAALAKQWWGPDGTTTLDLVTDAHVGGKFQWVFSTPESEGTTAEGVYQEVLPGEKLALTWFGTRDASQGTDESLVTVEFREIDAATTEIHLTHENLPSEESRDNHTEGWDSALDKLERLFVKKTS